VVVEVVEVQIPLLTDQAIMVVQVEVVVKLEVDQVNKELEEQVILLL
tara:strand:+ start:318 stop:458 length:141 start_codon:yes stop_codon:yes gene_type:complete